MTTYAMSEPHPVTGVALSLALARRGSVELTTDTVRVRLGPAWRADVPRASVTRAERDQSRPVSRGAHGWRGDWLVNTSADGLVALTIAPAARARCLGVPVRLTRLRVSLADPDGFLRELGSPTG